MGRALLWALLGTTLMLIGGYWSSAFLPPAWIASGELRSGFQIICMFFGCLAILIGFRRMATRRNSPR